MRDEHYGMDERNVDLFPCHIRRAFIFAVIFLCAGGVSLVCTRLDCQIEPLSWFSDLLAEGHTLAFLIAAAVGAAYLAGWSRIAVGLGVVKDVITYFAGDPDFRYSDR